MVEEKHGQWRPRIAAMPVLAKVVLTVAVFFMVWALVVFGVRPHIPEWTQGLDIFAVLLAIVMFFVIWPDEGGQTARRHDPSQSGADMPAASETAPSPSKSGLLILLLRILALIAPLYAMAYLVTAAIDTWVRPYFGESWLEPQLIRVCLILLVAIFILRLWRKPVRARAADRRV